MQVLHRVLGRRLCANVVDLDPSIFVNQHPPSHHVQVVLDVLYGHLSHQEEVLLFRS